MNYLESVACPDQENIKWTENIAKESHYHRFDQAITHANEEAWVAIQAAYKNLVRHWVRQTNPQISEKDLEDIVQVAFTKFWYCLSKKEGCLVEEFPHINAILQYMKRCTLSATIDHVRQQQRRKQLHHEIAEQAAPPKTYRRIESSNSSDAVQQVKKWVSARVTDPIEKLMLKLMFEYDLKPVEMVQRFPEHFPTTQEVRRVRERVLKRARRAFCDTAVSA